MQMALQMAERNLGQVWPNPAVGAIIVKDGAVVGQGATARGGRPHAETEALKQAGEKARDATMYVTLEPCNHQGGTPPCTGAIIDAGIVRCVVACGDSNPKVNGAGVAALKAAGIEVVENICRAEAEKINEGFFSLMRKNRPFVSLKIATSLDGKIATKNGESKWITGERARAYGQLLRSRYDAIVTGSGTWLADSPQLNCRLSGLEERSPQRVVCDRSGRITAEKNLWVLAEKSPEDVLKTLAEKGVTRVLVEAGKTLSTAFFHSGCVDKIYWFRAPKLIGEDGLSGVGSGFAAELASASHFKRERLLQLGDDTLEVLCSAAS